MEKITACLIVDYLICYLWFSIITKTSNPWCCLQKLLFWSLHVSWNGVWINKSQKSSCYISCTYTGCSSELLKTTDWIQYSAHIEAILSVTRIITMRIVLAVELIEHGLGDTIRDVLIRFWYKFTAFYDLTSFIWGENRRSFCLDDTFISVTTYNKLVTK